MSLTNSCLRQAIVKSDYSPAHFNSMYHFEKWRFLHSWQIAVFDMIAIYWTWANTLKKKKEFTMKEIPVLYL